MTAIAPLDPPKAEMIVRTNGGPALQGEIPELSQIIKIESSTEGEGGILELRLVENDGTEIQGIEVVEEELEISARTRNPNLVKSASITVKSLREDLPPLPPILQVPLQLVLGVISNPTKTKLISSELHHLFNSITTSPISQVHKEATAVIRYLFTFLLVLFYHLLYSIFPFFTPPSTLDTSLPAKDGIKIYRLSPRLLRIQIRPTGLENQFLEFLFLEPLVRLVDSTKLLFTFDGIKMEESRFSCEEKEIGMVVKVDLIGLGEIGRESRIEFSC